MFQHFACFSYWVGRDVLGGRGFALSFHLLNTCMLPLADALAQMVMELVATLWTFSMRAVDVGALLLSA